MTKRLMVPGSALALAMLTLAGCAAWPGNSSSPRGAAGPPAGGSRERVKLVWNVDQGFGAGMVVAGDTAGMDRICKALKPLQARYDVYVQFGPHVADRSNMDALLDVAVSNGIPFVLDVMTSDAMTMGAMPHTAAPDEAHCVQITVEDLGLYRERYGEWLAGIRFHEVLGQAFTAFGIASGRHPGWMHEGYSRAPAVDVDVFDVDVARPYLAFARDHGMFVQWSEWGWESHAQFPIAADAEPAARREAELKGLLGEFPGLVTVTYANNEPEESSRGMLDTWHYRMTPLVEAGARAFGLSNQAWLYNPRPMECPPGDLVAWMDRAFELGCTFIQFEPVFCFFNLPFPHGFREPETPYIEDPAWTDRGAPRAPFLVLRDFLMNR